MDAIPVLPDTADNAADIARSVTRIHGLIAALEADGVPAERIVVGGFSQVR